MNVVGVVMIQSGGTLNASDDTVNHSVGVLDLDSGGKFYGSTTSTMYITDEDGDG